VIDALADRHTVLHDFDAPSPEPRFIARDASGRWGAPATLLRIDALPAATSPDGRRLAFASDKGLIVSGPRGDSSRVLVLVSYRAHDQRPAYVSWSDDNRTRYYLAMDTLDRASIWGIDPATAGRKLLVRFDDPTREWHRYGFAAFRGRFYFTLGDRQSDLWTTSVAADR
jgi:dipeptidyl aminopeptidase/acylaminoacyl peptidase